MATNEHEKEVVYETYDGQGHEEIAKIYATYTDWRGDHLFVRHYPNFNQHEFLHEDQVAGIHTRTTEIPKERVFEVNSV